MIFVNVALSSKKFLCSTTESFPPTRESFIQDWRCAISSLTWLRAVLWSSVALPAISRSQSGSTLRLIPHSAHTEDTRLVQRGLCSALRSLYIPPTAWTGHFSTRLDNTWWSELHLLFVDNHHRNLLTIIIETLTSLRAPFPAFLAGDSEQGVAGGA